MGAAAGVWPSASAWVAQRMARALIGISGGGRGRQSTNLGVPSFSRSRGRLFGQWPRRCCRGSCGPGRRLVCRGRGPLGRESLRPTPPTPGAGSLNGNDSNRRNSRSRWMNCYAGKATGSQEQRLTDFSLMQRDIQDVFQGLDYELVRAVLTSVALWAAWRPLSWRCRSWWVHRGCTMVSAALPLAAGYPIGAGNGTSSVPTQAFEPRWPRADTSGFAYFPRSCSDGSRRRHWRKSAKSGTDWATEKSSLSTGNSGEVDRKKGEHIPLLFVKATFLNCEANGRKPTRFWTSCG